MRLLGAAMAAYGSLAFGAPVRDVRRLAIITPNSSTPRIIEYASSSPDLHLRLISPHPYKNPRRETNTWGGRELRRLLKHELSKGLNRQVVISGASGYSAQITEDDVRKHGIIVAHQRDGSRLKPEDGGPQLVYPLADSSLSDQLRSDAWWVWYVSGIFVGSPDPRLRVVRNGRTENRDLGKLKGVVHESLTPCYPAGQRMIVPPKSAVEASLLSLDSLAAGRPKVRKIIVHNHLGSSMEIDGDFEKYALSFSWNGETIRPSFGGPIQLVRRGAQPSCFFFVDRIEL